MMQAMLRLFSSAVYKDVVRRELVDELTRAVPPKIRNPGLRVLADNKYKVERMCYFIAHELHRRMLADRKNSQLYEGQLLQVKLFLMMIESHYAENRPQEPAALANDKKLDKDISGVDKFREAMVKLTK